ncbi:tRNA(adenine34) deaminase [Sporobolomyces koalae]|uniref:tRNA(adenine34) deaminase n=1 Tax=Sporobolomyces koalae TaxID=500713 RepID=UPI00316F131B
MIPLEEQSAQDLEFMDAAVAMAEEAFSAAEIPVGCVFVHDGQIIAQGRNRTNEGKNATLHAEFDALRHLLPERTHTTKSSAPRPSNAEECGERKIWQTPLKDVVLYVTVEPCIMCAAAMRQVGVEKVIYGAANDRFGGTGGVQSIHSDPRLLYSSPYKALGNYRREEAIMLLRRFYLTENTAAPKPKNKKNRVLKEEIEQVTLASTDALLTS